jgi:hypothetical protein
MPREAYTTATTTTSIVSPPQQPSQPDQQPSAASTMDDARLINIFDEPSSHRSSSYPPSSNSIYGDLMDGLGDSNDPLLNMSHSGTDDHDFFGGATTATAVARADTQVD